MVLAETKKKKQLDWKFCVAHTAVNVDRRSQEMNHQPGTADAGSHTSAPAATYDEKAIQESTDPSPLSSQKSNSSLAIGDAPVEQPQEKAHVTQDDRIAEEDAAAEGDGLKKVKSKHSVRDAGSIPDGGLWAWLQVLGGFFLLFNSWGIIVCPAPVRPAVIRSYN